MDDINTLAYDLQTSDPDVCSICGASPQTVQCNNADCWDRITNDERTDDED